MCAWIVWIWSLSPSNHPRPDHAPIAIVIQSEHLKRLISLRNQSAKHPGCFGISEVVISSALSKGWRSDPEAFRARPFLDFAETGNRTWKASGTPGIFDCVIIEKCCSVDRGRGICPLFSSPPRGIWQFRSPHPWEFTIQGKKKMLMPGGQPRGEGGWRRGWAQLEVEGNMDTILIITEETTVLILYLNQRLVDVVGCKS